MQAKKIRVHTEGLEFYTIVQELNTQHYFNGDDGALTANDTIEMVVSNEKNTSVFPNTRAYKVHKSETKITAVDCFNIETHRETRFEAPLFVDMAGKRESRRIMGDDILKESDILDHPDFEDGFVDEVRTIDIHYPVGGKYDFITEAQFTWIQQYKIPYRCLYSKDIENLFMAGRCFSATHVGLGSPRVMHTTAQMGVVVGYAAVIYKENNCTPRDVYKFHLVTMKERLGKIKSGAKFKNLYFNTTGNLKRLDKMNKLFMKIVTVAVIVAYAGNIFLFKNNVKKC